MLKVPGRSDFRREADHVGFERDVDQDRIVLVLYRLEQLCHHRPYRLARTLERLADPVGVGRIGKAERVRDLRRDLGNLEIQSADHDQDDIVVGRDGRLYVCEPRVFRDSG